MTRRLQGVRSLWAIGTLALLILATAAMPASAAGPRWRLFVSAPDDITAGKRVVIQGAVENVGDVPLSGSLTLTDAFPAGVTAVDPVLEGTVFGSSCQILGQDSSCTINVDGAVPGAQIRFRYVAVVDSGASGTLVNQVHVSGGGMASDATDDEPMSVSPAAPFAIKGFSMALSDESGSAAVHAGSAPREAENWLVFRSVASQLFPWSAPIEHLRDTIVHVPAGLIGNPTATPVRCTADQLAAASPDSPSDRIPNCPQDSQVGIAHLISPSGPDIVPLYNMVPPPGAPAEFGFSYDAITVVLVAKLRASDDGIDIVAQKAPSTQPIDAVSVTLWGVPADSSHDYLRHLCMDGYEGNFGGRACPSSAPRKPFLRLPTSCSGSPLPWGVDVTTYTHPDTAIHADTTTPGVEDCQLVPFDPSFELMPTDLTPHRPTGLDVTLSLPQDNGPDGIAEADLRTATVTLPEGMAINPSSADGLEACSDSDLRLGVDGVATCPDGSKIGTVTLTTPLLDHALGGSIFLRPQASSDPESGQLFRIAIEVRSDDDGIDLKLPGSVIADHATGQLTTRFDALPQLPFSTMRLHFKSGPRAPLTSPQTCGTYATAAELTSWSGKVVDTQSSFEISGDGQGAPCPGASFKPAFRAGSENPVAGASTPFIVSLRRDDGDEQFRSLSVQMPGGLLGRIKNAQLCPDATASTGACPDGSLIGRAIVGAGVGTDPFFITNGRVFLTGPYRGAPYGLAIVVRALAGPFDLGTVAVRAAIQLDKRTAALRIVSDPFPTLLDGVPLNVRDVRISVDKAGFMVNPTNCGKKQITGTATATTGAIAALSSRFQVGDCRDLGFSPRLAMRVGARGHTSRGGPTPVVTTIQQPAGQSNLRAVKVALPTVLSSRLLVVTGACTLDEFETNRCGRANVGSAVAVTPLLANPLRGTVYLVRRPGDRGLPDLMIALRGAVDLDLLGKVQISSSNQIVAHFAAIPDAPITRFTLRITGGRNGPLGLAANLCTRRARASTIGVSIRGQNGVLIRQHEALTVKGCPKPKRHRTRGR